MQASASILTLKKLGKKKEKVVAYINKKFATQITTLPSSKLTELDDGILVKIHGSWYDAFGTVEINEDGDDLTATIQIKGGASGTTYLLACLGIPLVGLLTIAVWFIYDSEKKNINETFIRVAESIVKSAEKEFQ